MKEKESQTILVTYVGKNENVVAYCPTCERPVFKGNDKIQGEKRILRERVKDHLVFFNGRHQIDIVYPRRSRDQVVDMEELLLPKAYFDIGRKRGFLSLH